MFLKEKRDGTIKGRTCADGRKQRETAKPGAATSPTVSLESVLITSTNEAFEGREVAVVDIPGAYLSADMDEEVIMPLRGRFAELVVKTAPNILCEYISVDAKINLCFMLIPQVRPAHKYPNSPWETIHPPGGYNAECVYPYKVYTAECNKSLTSTYQCKTPIPSNKLLVNNILTNN
jgi:hypothetical protein